MTSQGFQGLTVAAFESRMAVEMVRLIERYGGKPLVAPSMREIPLQNNREALEFGERLLSGEYDMVILLTGVGVRTMIDVLKTRHPLESIKGALASTKLVTRGSKSTAVLKELGLTAHLVAPEPNTWRDLLRTLDQSISLNGLRIAVLEYGISNADLLQALRDRGALVSQVPVYRWSLPKDLTPLRTTLEAILAGGVDVILVTNAVQIDHAMQLLTNESYFKNGSDQFLQVAERMVLASIGPTAGERLRRYGLTVDLEPSHPKMGILVKESAERAHAILKLKRSARS